MKPVVHVTIRRWFQRTYGHTYHTATLHFSDGSAQKSGIAYGYGDQGLQTAVDMMGGPREAVASTWLREQGISFDVVDVSRRKDL